MQAPKVKIKILGLSTAARKDMNTSWLVMYCLKVAEKAGRILKDYVDVETELVDLADKEIKPCRNCEYNHLPNRGRPYKGPRPQPIGCPITDDYMALVLRKKLKEADGFVFGSPVFGLSTSSKLSLLKERMCPSMWAGDLTNKPAVSVAVGEMPGLGQEECLEALNLMIRGGEMICVSWPMGVAGVSGPPFGPGPSDGDYATRIGAKGDRFATWLCGINGRRLVEFAYIVKSAKLLLGDAYTREFVQVYHPPRGDEPWAWTRLDKEDEEFMKNWPPKSAPA